MIAENIRRYIKDNNMNQTAIGRKAGITKQAMSTSLLGKRKFTLEEYVSICNVLKVSTDFFTQDIQEKESADEVAS